MRITAVISFMFCLLIASCAPEVVPLTAEEAFEKAELASSNGNDGEAFDSYLYAAELGHRQSMVRVAYFYEGHSIVPVDLSESYHWFKKAATPEGNNLGNAYAQYNVGYYNVEGYGRPVNYEAALYWYRLGAEQGETNAMYDLGTMYKNGEGIEVDAELALYWFEKSALAGDRFAQYGLALEYLDGTIVEPNESEAKSWLTLAVKNDVPPAFSALAELYLEEGDVVNKEEMLAIGLLRRGIELGDKNSQILWDSMRLSEVENTSSFTYTLDEILDGLN